jgi:PAS domain S-box-containing protein
MLTSEHDVVWFRDEAILVPDEEGELDRLQGVMMDITHQREAEEQHKILKMLSEQSDLGFGWAELDGTILSANWSLCRMMGENSLQGPIGQGVRSYYAPDAMAELEEKILPLVLREGQWVGEIDLMAIDGTVTPTIQNIFLVKSDDGEPQYFANVLTDISERKRAEEALREEKAFTETALDAQVDTFFVFDPAMRKAVRWNKAMRDVSGYSDEEIAAMKAPDDWYGGKDLQRAKDAIETIYREGETTMEMSLITKEGTAVPFEYRASAVRDADGNPLYIIAVGRDITERRRAEQERRRLEMQVLHTQKLESLGVLAGGIAHDFNNILLAILGNVDLVLREVPRRSPIRESVEDIELAAQRAADLTRQMLAYAGRGQFEVKALNLTGLVEETERLLRSSVSKTIFLTLHLRRDLPLVRADATQIQQIVMNLVVNASEAIGEQETGTVTVSTGVAEYDRAVLVRGRVPECTEAGEYVYLEVTDSGGGMDKEARQRLFDPFFTTKFAGRGLGMSATLGIVRGHEGTIFVDSEPGRGTTIRVLLPALDESVPAQRDRIHAEDSDRWRGEGTILLVDDEERIRSVSARMLRRLGFDVLVAGDGHEAIEVFREHHDEIVGVLLDFSMPHMDGARTHRELRAIRDDIPVILSSGYTEMELERRFGSQGIAAFIQKPYRLRGLEEKLRRALGQ